MNTFANSFNKKYFVDVAIICYLVELVNSQLVCQHLNSMIWGFVDRGSFQKHYCNPLDVYSKTVLKYDCHNISKSKLK